MAVHSTDSKVDLSSLYVSNKAVSESAVIETSRLPPLLEGRMIKQPASAGHMARDCQVKSDPNTPTGSQSAGMNKGNFDSEHANLMAERGESAVGAGTGKNWAGGGSGLSITAGGSDVPPWRRPEMWQTSTPTNQNAQNGYRTPQTYAGGTANLVAIAKKEGPSVSASGFTDAALKALADKKSPAARGPILEPIFVSSGLYAALLETFADKMPAVRTAAVDAVKAYVAAMNPWAAVSVLPALLQQIKTAGKWQIKTGALTILNQLVVSAPEQTAKLMPEIVPILSEAIWDTKADVKKAARDTLTKATALISNKDIGRFIPALINALAKPVEEVPKTIQLLAATTFVSEVEFATLSLMVPLLSRGLNEKLTATKRKVAVIVDNMPKLVDSATTVRPFLPKLLPDLIQIKDAVSDPEARGVVERTIATLRQVGEVPTGDGTSLPPLKTAEPSSLASVNKKLGASSVPPASDVTVQYVGALAAALVNLKNFDNAQWQSLAPYLEYIAASPEPEKVAAEFMIKSSAASSDDDHAEDDEEEG
ncbi:TEF3_2 [Sanghuangporus weigelae]